MQSVWRADQPLPLRSNGRSSGLMERSPDLRPRGSRRRAGGRQVGVADLAIRDGRLVGRATTDTPILHLERTSGFEDADALHAIEIRMRVSDGANFAMQAIGAPTVILAAQPEASRDGGLW